MTELKPCPFCGGKSTIRQVTPVRDGLTLTYNGYFVICEECLTSGDNYSTKERAIDAWNRRYQDE